MIWNLSSDRPIYIQLVEQLKLAIVSGLYIPGDKLPSVRELAAEASVNPNTMQRALTELEESGLIITQRTAGRVVTDNAEIISRTKNSIASEILKEFIAKMSSLGFTIKETSDYVINNIKEDDNNE